MSLELYEIRELQRIATVLVGLPYKYGAELNPEVPPERLRSLSIPTDCSELVEYMYRRIGYIIPDGSANQYRVCIPGSVQRHGSLVFRRNSSDKKICHVGMVIDAVENMVIEATPPAVRIVSIDIFARSSKVTEFAGIGYPELKRIPV